VKTDITCCCPDPDKCKCHDDQAPQPIEHIKRCAGAIHIDALIVVAIALPDAPVVVAPISTATQIAWPPMPIPSDRVLVPEKPPF
jgi:hypothetical protein